MLLLPTTSGTGKGNVKVARLPVITLQVIQVRRHLEDWMLNLRAARGQGLLQLPGDGARLPRHSGEAE